MLAEAYRYVTTPCSPYARKLGYLKESIAIDARYARCKKHWAEHLKQSKHVMVEAANGCNDRRKVVVLGSGGLYDVPLEELSKLFEVVQLVDIVHPLHAKQRAKKFTNVILTEHDITELSSAPHSFPPRPCFLLDDAQVDLVISANILSQLALLPARQFARQGAYEQAVTSFSRDITAQHMAYLQCFEAVTCLITDTQRMMHNRQGHLIHSEDATHGLNLSTPQHQWVWQIAPLKETRKNYTCSHIMSGYIS